MSSRIIEKLAKIMGDIPRVEKRGYNSFHGYEYAMESDFLDAVRNKLAAQGIFVLTSVTKMDRLVIEPPAGSSKGKSYMVDVELTHTFCDGDDKLEVKSFGSAIDNQDKAVYKAITGAMKYFISKNFLIATGDDPEKDHDAQEGDNGQPPGPPAKTAPPKTKPAAAPKAASVVKASEEVKQAAAAEKKANKPHSERYSKWLDFMRGEKKRMGDGMYYSLLKGFGFEHSNQIPEEDHLLQEAIFWQMKSMVADPMYKDAPSKAEEAMKKLVERDRQQ